MACLVWTSNATSSAGQDGVAFYSIKLPFIEAIPSFRADLNCTENNAVNIN